MLKGPRKGKDAVAPPAGMSIGQAPKARNTARLFVGQIPFQCTDDRLRELFGCYGTVREVHVLRDASGRSKGSAFVTYETAEEADIAIYTLHDNYRMLHKKPMQVSYAKSSATVSRYGSYMALRVHEENPTNPLPDCTVAAVTGTMGAPVTPQDAPTFSHAQ